MNPWVQTVLITGAAAGAFAGLRSIPASQCEFLHYEVTEVTAEGDAVCDVEQPPAFMNLQRLQFPVELRLEGTGELRAGQQAHLALELVSAAGQVLLPHELAITHTKKLHLMIVDPSLGDYRHIHPEPAGTSGQWQFTFTPEHGGEYFLVAEFVPVRTLKPVVGHAYLAVAGAQAARHPQPASTVTVAGHRFTLECDSAPVRRGQDAALTLSIARGDGEPVQLEPVMDALAHLVAFDSGLTGYAHLHPLQPEEGAGGPDEEVLAFVFNSNQSGHYRLWAQVRIDGQDAYAPFDVTVK